VVSKMGENATVTVPGGGNAEINGKIYANADKTKEMELTVDQDGNISVTGGAIVRKPGGLHFEGVDSVTINGVAYKGGDENAKYNVIFGTNGQNRVELADNNTTKVTVTFSKHGDSLTTDRDQVNGADVNEGGNPYNDLLFSADSAPSSIVISKDAASKVNVTNGSRTSMAQVKDEETGKIHYEVKRVSSGSSSTSSSSGKALVLHDSKYGTVSVDQPYASKDQTVTITTKPDEGSRLGNLTVTDSKGHSVELKDLGNGKYSFVQPKDAPVPVKAVFVDKSSCDRDENCPAYPFKDLD